MTDFHQIIEVALPTRIADSLDYLAEESMLPQLQPGIRIEVEFGSRILIGIILNIKAHSDFPRERLKSIISILDPSPLLPARLLTFFKRSATYYHHPLGDAIFAGLPKHLRQGRPFEPPPVTLWLAATPQSPEKLPELARAPRQAEILQLLQQHPQGLPQAALAKTFSQPTAALKALRQKGLIRTTEATGFIAPDIADPVPAIPPPTLNTEQAEAVKTLLQHQASFNVFLLDGITGSGKTEVYLHLIAPLIQSGRQVLILVPEISLTPQLRQRFSARFRQAVTSLHSGMNDTERLDAWRQAATGQAQIVLGTRSAVFTPMPKLGYIIIDEEHDTSLKQGEGYRYHARDLAIFRAQLEDCPVLLGSATPSLETLANVARGRYGCVRLRSRAGVAQPPVMHLVDLKRQNLTGGLSDLLLTKMQQHLENGHQVLLFLNRRGYAPAMLCHECGYLVDCPRCDAHMTYHAQLHALHCHHCGHISRPPVKCPDCGKKALHPVGLGTQKIEDAIHSCFPDYATIRIDRDSMSRKHALQNALEAIRSNKYQIIIGTQMLAKGHDFHNITLVGMIDMDQGLFSSDYHAPERLAQQVLQVSGRAGRGSDAGEVVIQTLQPENPLLQSLLAQDYGAIVPALETERKLGMWPPYCFLALFRASAHHADDARTCLNEILQLARQQGFPDLELLGPAPAPMERKAGRFRFQLLLRSSSRGQLHQCLRNIMPHIRKLKAARKARWSLDIDPVDLT